MPDKEPLKGTIPTDLPTLFVPILFFPGMMATRLKKLDEEKTIWDPDSEIPFFLSMGLFGGIFGNYSRVRKIIEIREDNKAEPITKDQGFGRTMYDETQRKSGFAECYSSFEKLLKKMDKEFNRDCRPMVRGLQIKAPVEVIGYDWRDEPAKIVEYVKVRLDRLIDKYCGEKYKNIPQAKFRFIIVTHSMGSLIARKLLQEDKKKGGILEKQVLGVIHGNQPTVGSPKFYAYFKSGASEVNNKTVGRFSITEKILSSATGKTALDFQYIASGAPGSLILLPTNDYAKKKWLTCDFKKDGPITEKIKKAMKDIDDTDYAKRGEINPDVPIWKYYKDKSGYIGLLNSDFEKKHGKAMVKEAVEDAAQGAIKDVIKGAVEDKDIVKEFYKSLKFAEEFHKQIGEGDNMYAHPQTYEISSSKYNTVQGVKLIEKDIVINRSSPRDLPEMKKIGEEFHAELIFSKDGDATVPLSSQRALSEKKKVEKEDCFFLEEGKDHQNSYNAEKILDYTCNTIEKILLSHFSSVYFAQDSSEIDKENKDRLNRLISLIFMMDEEDKRYNYMVTGYASYEGDAGYNSRLSKERAEAVKKYLVDKLLERVPNNKTKSKEDRQKEYEKRFDIESKGATIKAGEQRNQETKERWRRVDIRRK